MPQVVPGHLLGSGANNQPLAILFGSGDPNSVTAPSQTAANTSYVSGVATPVTPLITNVVNAFVVDVGSLYLRLDGSTSTTLYVKTALPNTWTAK